MLLLSGYACRYGLLSDGQRQITGVFVAGDLLGVRSGDVPSASQTIATVSDAEVAKIPHAAIMALADARVAIARALWNETILDANAAGNWIVSLGRRDARGRVLALLQELTNRSREAGLTIRDLLREAGTPYAELGLADPALTDDQLLAEGREGGDGLPLVHHGVNISNIIET